MVMVSVRGSPSEASLYERGDNLVYVDGRILQKSVLAGDQVAI